MMEEGQPLHARLRGRVDHILHWAVSPTDAVGVLGRGVLGIVDDQVGTRQKLDVALIARMQQMSRATVRLALPAARIVRFVVGRVDDGYPAGGHPVSQGERRVIQVLCLDRRITDRERILAQVVELDLGLELVEADREVGVLHLPGQDAQELFVAARWRVDRETVARHEGRPKERKALDVVPMGVTQKHRAGDWTAPLEQREAKAARPGPTIEHDQRAGLRAELDAGGVAAVPQGRAARGGNRATRPPEPHLHLGPPSPASEL
jgi:hypothetical protein